MTHTYSTQDPIISMLCNTLKERLNSDPPACPGCRWHLQSLYSSSYEIGLGMLLSRKCWSPSRVTEILEIYIFFFSGREMELPFLVAHLSLFSDDGRPLDMGAAPNGDAPPRRLLYGNLVSSPQKLRDLQGRLGLYFLFSDVSIRWRGRFQIGISLLRISQ